MTIRPPQTPAAIWDAKLARNDGGLSVEYDLCKFGKRARANGERVTV